MLSHGADADTVTATQQTERPAVTNPNRTASILATTMPHQIWELADSVHREGGTAWLVGGTVRDAATGTAGNDYDIEIHGLDLERLQSVLHRHTTHTDNVGAAFGVIKADIADHTLDVSIPRRDSKQHGTNTRGIIAQPDPHMGIVEALRRRDFTINAIAYNLHNRTITDPYGGLNDLAHQRLRVVDADTFPEDPLRVLRAAGFAGRLNLTTDPATDRILAATTADLGSVSSERYWAELTKLLTKSARPSTGLDLAHRVGALAVVLPEVAALSGVKQDPQWHPEGDAYVHTLKSVDAAAAVSDRDGHGTQRRLLIAVAALLHDIGKAPVWAARGDAVGHDKVGANMVKEVLSRLHVDRHTGTQVASLTALHMRGHTMGENISLSGLRRFCRDLSPASADLLADLLDADTYGRDRPGASALLDTAREHRSSGAAFVLDKVKTLGAGAVESTVPDNLVTGADLLAAGMVPGRHIGSLIEEANNMDCTKQEALAVLVASAGAECWTVPGKRTVTVAVARGSGIIRGR